MVWWPTLFMDFRDFVRTCDACQRTGKPVHWKRIRPGVQPCWYTRSVRWRKKVKQRSKTSLFIFHSSKEVESILQRANGQAFTTNKVLISMLTQCCETNGEDWSHRWPTVGHIIKQPKKRKKTPRSPVYDWQYRGRHRKRSCVTQTIPRKIATACARARASSLAW